MFFEEKFHTQNYKPLNQCISQKHVLMSTNPTLISRQQWWPKNIPHSNVLVVVSTEPLHYMQQFSIYLSFISTASSVQYRQ